MHVHVNSMDSSCTGMLSSLHELVGKGITFILQLCISSGPTKKESILFMLYLPSLKIIALVNNLSSTQHTLCVHENST